VDTAPGSKLLVGLCYRKPNSSNANNESLLEAMEAASQCKIASHMTIFGDFNYRSIDYAQYSVAPDRGLALQVFFEKTQHLFLVQNVHAFTRCREGQRSSVLDYIFTDEENMIDDLEYLAPLGKSDHACLIWSMAVMQTPIDDSTEKLNYWKGDYDSISQDLSSHNELQLLADTQNVHDAWLLFKTKLLDSISRHVPKRKTQARRKKKSEWLLKSTVKQIQKRGKAWNSYRRCPTDQKYADYKKIRNQVNTLIRADQNAHRKNILKSLKGNPKKFYSLMRSVQTVKCQVSMLKKVDGTMTTDDSESAQELCNYFGSVFVKDNTKSDPFAEEPKTQDRNGSQTKTEIQFDYDLVRKKLSHLQEDISAGPDGIHPIVLKHCTEVLATPLSIIFQKSYADGEIPNDWKLANISPIHKKGSKNKSENYRPISLTSVVCKVMKSIIKEKITGVLDNRKLINCNQHGFTAGRSCLTNLLETLKAWTRLLLDEGYGMSEKKKT